MLIDIMTYTRTKIKRKRSHVLTTCNTIKMPVGSDACKATPKHSKYDVNIL